MSPNTWTQLFFLDEATAYAAGHRPCAECRNADYKRFRERWERSFGPVRTVDDIDEVLHSQRLDGRAKRMWQADIATLPDGAFVLLDNVVWIVWGPELAAWTDSGYGKRKPRPERLIVDVLTPQSIVQLMRTDLRPAVHPTLEKVSSRLRS